MTALKRQFITDIEGSVIGVILPPEEYALVKEFLDQRTQPHSELEDLARMAQAANDPLFLADLHEVMGDFAATDAEWWEPAG